MATYIDFKITDAGLAAAFNAANTGVEISLTHIAFGSGFKTPDGTESALVNEAKRVVINYGSRVSPTQIRVSGLWIGDESRTTIAEVGIYADDILFAYASNATGTALGTKNEGVDFNFYYDWVLSGVPDGSVNVIVDTTGNVALAALAAHEADQMAHQQYLRRDRVAQDAGPLGWGSVAGGAADAIELTLDEEAVIEMYKPGQAFEFVAQYNNLSAVSVDVNGLGIRAVRKNGGAALIADDIVAGTLYRITYDGLVFQLASTLDAYTKKQTYSAKEIDSKLAGKQGEIGFEPVQQGGGTDQVPGKIRIGKTTLGASLQVDDNNLGNILTDQTSIPGGVCLTGPTTVFRGTTNSYVITNYHVFSKYTVAASAGTVSISGDTISLVIPDPAGASQIELTVFRDAKPYKQVVAVGASTIAKPSILSPSNNQTEVSLTPTFVFSDFASAPAGLDTFKSAELQISTNAAFTSLIYNPGPNTAANKQITLPSGVVNPGEKYYSRLRFNGNALGASTYSDTVAFTIIQRFVMTPTMFAAGGPTDVAETPLLTTSAFQVFNGTDEHLSTDWQVVRVSDGVVVWQKLGDTVNKLTIPLPSNVLEVSKQYRLRGRHNGATLGAGNWGEYTFTTKSEFFIFGPQSYGLPYGGGFYAGNMVQNGEMFALIVAPKALGGELVSVAFYNYIAGINDSQAAQQYRSTPGDGKLNCDEIVAFAASRGVSITRFESVSFARSLRIGGFDDWYVPAFDELEMLYRNLKPNTNNNTLSGDSPYFDPNGINSTSRPVGERYTSANPAQTAAANFKATGQEALSNNYWSSTRSGRYVSFNALTRNFQDGGFISRYCGNKYSTRAVRRVRIEIAA